MPFKRSTDKTFRADVKVPVVNAKGEYDWNTFVAIFSHASSTEQEQLRKLSNRELIEKKLEGWELVDADTNEQVPFNKETLAAILEIPPTPMQMGIAFWETVNGARAKNS